MWARGKIDRWFIVAIALMLVPAGCGDSSVASPPPLWELDVPGGDEAAGPARPEKRSEREARRAREGRRAIAAPPPIEQAASPAAEVARAAVSARGRLEPRDGVVFLYGPSHEVSVVSHLAVEKGEIVEFGELVARIEGRGEVGARVDQTRAVYQEARAEHLRALERFRARRISRARLDMFATDLQVARARLFEAEAKLSRTEVRAPFRGRVLDVHTKVGERVGEHGIVEFARTSDMRAVAEVHQSDIARIAAGQIARITSPVLAQPLFGTVERVALKVGRTAPGQVPQPDDDQIIEVEILLDDDARAKDLTNLQVEIEIGGDA